MSQNKSVVRRFNHEVIENLDMAAFSDLVSPEFINHSAPPGVSKGSDGFAAFFTNVLHQAFTDIKVLIHDQLEENDKVATRKTIEGTHSGPFFGHAKTGKRISIQVTDIVHVKGGKYIEHWGSADIYGAIAQISKT
ncbi:ester cyclase [Geothrix oryzisoli]|uniref:ester cyclase n=1 Tax=Geothrix oryzisoli TaxID=2922721 RepID=UPI001FAD4DC5|nr:ester cyclase [Geothrix oryzisoli]